MLRNITIITLLSMLILSSVANHIVLQRYKASNSEIKNLEYLVGRYEYQKKRDSVKYLQNISSQNRFLKNVYLFESSYDSVLLSQILKDDSKLVYRFYQESCNQCIEDELNIVKLIGDRIGHDKIIVLGSHDNINGLIAVMNRKKILSRFYNYPNRLGLPIDQDPDAIPTFFVVDKNLRTDFVYKAGGNQSIDNPYFTRIIEFLNPR